MAFYAISFFYMAKLMGRDSKDKVEYSAGVCCVMAAITIGISSIIVSEHHDIAAGVLIFVAQLLIFAASVFHLNYKLGNYGQTTTKNNTDNQE